MTIYNGLRNVYGVIRPVYNVIRPKQFDSVLVNPIINLNKQYSGGAFPIYIPVYRDKKPPPHIKDEYNYKQQFDFRQNPLFQCNPPGINDCVNSSNAGCKTNRVRFIINGLASTDNRITNTYNLALSKTEESRKNVIAKYDIDNLTPEEYANIQTYIKQIHSETEKEYNQVSKLVNNQKTLVESVSNDIDSSLVSMSFMTIGMIYLNYRYFMPSHIDYHFIDYILCNKIMFQYWGWLVPISKYAEIVDLKKKRTELVDLYSEYTKENYMGRYQHKLNMLSAIGTYFQNKFDNINHDKQHKNQ